MSRWLRYLLISMLAAHSAAAQGVPANICQHRIDVAKLQDGDVLFIRSHTSRAEVIQKVTGSSFTHCGIVFYVNGDWKVYEGAGRHTQYLKINDWQDCESAHDEKTGRIIAYEPISIRRLADTKNWPDKDKTIKLAALQAEAKKLHETCYDLGFAWNNHCTFQNSQCAFSKNPADIEYIYCSELVYKAFQRALNVELAPLKKLSDYYPLPADAQALLNSSQARACRGGLAYDPAEPVISPYDLSMSPFFETIDAEIP